MLENYKNSYLSYFLMYNFYYLSWALFAALISVYLMGKGMSATQVSLIVSMSYLTSMICQPVVGMLSDRYGVKKINAVLFVLAAAGGLFFAFANSFLTMLIGYSFVLTMLNSSNPLMEKIATASPYQYGKIRIWGTIGYTIGTQAAGLIYDHISPQAIFFCYVITMLLCIIGTLGTEPDIHPAEKSAKSSPLVLFRNRKYLYFLLISLLFTAATSASNTYVPSMLVDEGMSAGTASTFLSFAVLCEFPFVLFSGKFMDKVPNRTLLLISYTMVCIQFAVYAFDLPLTAKVLATLLVKHSAAMLYIMINLKVVHTVVEEEHVITALAFVATAKNLIMIVSQNVAGSLVDACGYPRMFLLFFIILLIGWILTFLFKVDSGNDLHLFS